MTAPTLPIQIDSEDLLQRFLTYVQIDTQSDHHSDSTPSTAGQWDLIHLLAAQLKEIGASDVHVTEFGYVLATVPATSARPSVPAVAFLAHVDTADSCSGKAIPLVHRNYHGGTIVLPDDPAVELNPAAIPLLSTKIGETLITASGKTLLGADDKAGVAIVMAAARHLLSHPEIPHGVIRICFNPDEEIGRGTEKLALEDLGARAAYTLDSELPGEVDFESFSAEMAVVNITGVAAHPGWAKGVMVNALRLAGDFLRQLPLEVSAERSSGREGFIHLREIAGTAEHVRIEMLVRDFELEGLSAKRVLIEGICEALRAGEPAARIQVEFKNQYRNMRYWLENDMRPVEYALEAVARAGLTPFSEAIRGGTDGSRLTERGLPTPNIFTGFHNVHSEKEWVSLQDMCKAAEVVVRLAQVWEERS